MGNDKKITIKLLVDKHQSRVLLAESDKDFVDILLSFLTMPMGTIARLLSKDSSIGCISNLYKSVEILDKHHLQTDACRNMLLRPLNAARQHCENLVLSIDKTNHRLFFTCEKKCTSRYYSSIPGVKCSCGTIMNWNVMWDKNVTNVGSDGVFVKGGLKFMISDDISITPSSTSALLSLCDKLRIEDGSILEERVVDLGEDEILHVLRLILTSRTPLTDLCFHNSTINTTWNVSDTTNKFQRVPKSEDDGESESGVKVKLLSTTNNKKIIHMEGGEEIVDLVFHFLTLPLGSVIKLLYKNSSMGCADNLYNSVEILSSPDNNCIKSEYCKTLLVDPKLPSFFSCKNHPLNVEEMKSRTYYSSCYICLKEQSSRCYGHSRTEATLYELNPKLPSTQMEIKDGYAKGPCKFMITDGLHVSISSPFSTVHINNELGASFNDLEEMEVSIGKIQALNMLKAALTSEMALTKVFCPSTRQHGAFLD